MYHKALTLNIADISYDYIPNSKPLRNPRINNSNCTYGENTRHHFQNTTKPINMCNLHFAIYSCKHIQELHTTQCPIWLNTSSMCAKPQTTTQSVATLCYQCSIIEESSQVDLATLDRKARGLLKGLTD